MKISRHLFSWIACLCFTPLLFADSKPKLTLDEFFNSVSYSSVAGSPDGNSVVIGTERADWDQQMSRTDLWLDRDTGKVGSLIQRPRAGHATAPKWPPHIRVT